MLSIQSTDITDDEKYFHKRFEGDRKKGEWFFLSKELENFMKYEHRKQQVMVDDYGAEEGLDAQFFEELYEEDE